MNVTELARKLKISTKELREELPQLGFDIGMKAIKVDDALVDKIVAAWEEKKRELAAEKSREKVERVSAEAEVSSAEKIIKIPETVSVHGFAEKIGLPINKVMAELMNNGIMVTINEEIDFETAAIIAEDLGIKVAKGADNNIGIKKEKNNKDKLESLLKERGGAALQTRPPIVVVMGHVDHGKTSLLDAIRKTNVVASEAGAITQHIGAYQVEHKGRTITFVDTPGHEAFKSMRVRGGGVADIAILVIAADDDVQPQTIESIRVIQQEKLPFIVAINKIDKPEADVNKIKTSLAEINLSPEDWGGKTICVEVSAMKKQGLDELLEMILLVADMEKENLQVEFSRPAVGTIIESRKDKNEGPAVTVLVQTGTCRVGDSVVVGETYGKIRALKNFKGEDVQEAVPGTPVRLLGVKGAPSVGDILEVIADPKEFRKKIKTGVVKKTTDFKLGRGIIERIAKPEELEIKNLNIILRADAVGSMEAIVESIEAIKHEEINLNIVKKALGNITESDVIQAEASEGSGRSAVIGFNVALNPGVKALAQEKGVNIKTYKVIYELIEDIRKNLESLLSLEIIRLDVGKLEVMKIFRTEADTMIIGGRVTKGKIVKNVPADILRNGKVVGIGKIVELQSNKQEVSEIKSGSECGLKVSGNAKIEEGDVLELYRVEKRAKTL